MQIGFVSFNQEEKNKVYKVLQLLRDQRAIDELGVGRLRDAFANAMFPGMSTLHGHAKYFALLPALYHQAQKKQYKSLQEVKDEIRRMEINITKQLINGTPEELRIGITGSDNIDEALRDLNKYMKYDPTYIYHNALITYGIIKPQGNLYVCIFEQSKRYNDSEARFRLRPTDDDAGDDDCTNGTHNFFETCGEAYDFSKSSNKQSIELTRKEASFIKSHIETQGDSLIAYILRNDIPIEALDSSAPQDVFTHYEMLGELWKEKIPEPIIKPYRFSLKFSRFVYLLRLVYELEYTEKTGDAEYNEKLTKLLGSCLDDKKFKEAIMPETVNMILDYFGKEVNEPTLIRFCKTAAEKLSDYFDSRSDETLNALKSLIEEREKKVKGSKRSKLAHSDEYMGQKHGLAAPLSYRWGIVRVMINEIRKGLKDGE